MIPCKIVTMSEYYLNTDRIKGEIARRGYTSLSRFLRDAGLHRNTLRYYEQKQKTVFSSAVERIAKFLELDPMRLCLKEDRANSKSADKAMLLKVLRGFRRKYPTIAFSLIGSRARGRARRNSDWDVAFSGGITPLKVEEYLALKDQFETAVDDLPTKVDLVNLDMAPQWFLDDLRCTPKFLCGDKAAYYFMLGKLSGVQETK